MIKKIILILVLLNAAELVYSQCIISEIPKAKTYYEISKSETANGNFQIVFYSQSSKTKDEFSHAYIGFFCYPKCYGNNCFDVFGFYPRIEKGKNKLPSNIRSIDDARNVLILGFDTFEGAFKDDSSEKPDYALAVNVSLSDYNNARDMLNSYKIENLSYQGLTSNCIDFAEDVAKCIGLKIPLTSIQQPNKFVKQLYILNK